MSIEEIMLQSRKLFVVSCYWGTRVPYLNEQGNIWERKSILQHFRSFPKSNRCESTQTPLPSLLNKYKKTGRTK